MTLLNNRYKLTAQQGSGGMAVIYKAVDQSLGRTVAVKILRPSLTADPQFVVRFQNEARSIANLVHPNIVTVHDVGSDGQTNYIVMEFIDGSDLKKVIRAYGTLPLPRALNFAISICAGLGYAHRSKIVHADVKPQNILITQDDVVKITDFGIAQVLSETQPQTRADVVWGSPHYFAPEQAQGEKPTAAADVYSIGIVMFEMLTGRLPYMGTNQQELAMAHINADIPDVREFNPNVPEPIARIVHKAMSKKPNDRYKMADQLGRVLIGLRDQGIAATMRDMPVEVDSDPAPPERPAVPPESMMREVAQQQRPSVSTPPPPTEPRQQQVEDYTPPPPNSPVTQRYSPAPNAPVPIDYQQRSVPNPNPTMQGQMPSPPNVQGQPQQMQRTDSGPYNPRPPYMPPQEDIEFAWDGVTIALAILAFMAVACLIPLYIGVFSARLG